MRLSQPDFFAPFEETVRSTATVIRARSRFASSTSLNNSAYFCSTPFDNILTERTVNQFDECRPWSDCRAIRENISELYWPLWHAVVRHYRDVIKPGSGV